MAKPRLRDEHPLLHTVEEATELLRRVTVRAWVWWFAGTAPFVCAMLHFISDMSRAASASERLAPGALVLALTYWWMKVAHSVFSDHLLRYLRLEDQPQPLPLRGRLRLVTSQAVIHATAPWMLLLSLIAMLPFGWVYAFYHNVSVLTLTTLRGGGRVRDIIRSSVAQSHYRQGQNHGLMVVLLVTGVLVWMNLFVGSLLTASLLKSITGEENVISRNPWIILSSGSFAATIGLSYLFAGPLVKAVYAVRCFYSLSRKNGEDIAVRFRMASAQASAIAAFMVIMLCGAGECRAANSDAAKEAGEHAVLVAPAVDAPTLDANIRDVLKQDIFQWRLPREALASQQDDGWLSTMMRDVKLWIKGTEEEVGKWLDKMLFDWIKEQMRKVRGDEKKDRKHEEGEGAWVASLQSLLWVLLGVLTVILGWLVYRQWRVMPPAPVAAVPVAAEVNLENEAIVASQLPENEWLRLAQEKMDAGDFRLAMRALFLATLAHLGDQRLIAIARSKSNGDYVRELGFRARDREGLRGLFADSVRVFDRAWYGWHEVTRDLLDHFRNNHQSIVADGHSSNPA